MCWKWSKKSGWAIFLCSGSKISCFFSPFKKCQVLKIVEPLFEIFDKNLILHSKFQKKSMLMTQYRLLSHRKWLSIRYWGMLRNALLWGPWSLKFRHLLNRWPWPNIVGCHYCCGPTKPPILDLFAITQYSILSHNKLLSIEYWVLKDTESLYFTISTLCTGAVTS